MLAYGSSSFLKEVPALIKDLDAVRVDFPDVASWDLLLFVGPLQSKNGTAIDWERDTVVKQIRQQTTRRVRVFPVALTYPPAWPFEKLAQTYHHWKTSGPEGCPATKNYMHMGRFR